MSFTFKKTISDIITRYYYSVELRNADCKEMCSRGYYISNISDSSLTGELQATFILES